ncbi:MAG: LysM peptidoglycan-binding domain-containing protein [Lachnospiraceae bacterium]|nr:LysM peptidoglycan-binding domain-containing protein [Lachnospiraceae bacterium]
MKKRILVLSIIVVAVFVLILGVKSIWTSAKQIEGPAQTCYESYLIRENDSLWSIAREYAPKMNMSITSYIEELKRVNGLTSDQIRSGGKIVVLYAENP